MKKRKRMLQLVVAGLIASVGSSNAALIAGQSIGLDFGSNSGVDAAPTGWNAVSADVDIIDLIDIDTSAPTGVGLAISSGDGTAINFFNDDSGQTGSASSPTDTVGPVPSPFTTPVAEDWSGVVNGDEYAIDFSGLNDSLTYNVLVYVGAWTANSVIDDATVTASSGQSGSYGDIGLNGALVTLTGVTTDGSGNLSIDIDGANPGGLDSGAVVNVVSGVYLEAIPEPATLGLVALFGGGILFIRRRKMK